LLNFVRESTSERDILRNWSTLEPHVDDGLYEQYLPPSVWQTGSAFAPNNERGNYIALANVANERIWTNLMFPKTTWRDGFLTFTLLYTGSVSSTANISMEILANAVSIGESVDAGTDLQVTESFPGPATTPQLQEYTFAGRLAVNSGQHRLVTLRLLRIVAAYAGTVRFEGLIVRFAPARRELDLR